MFEEEKQQEERQRAEDEANKPKGMWDKFVNFVKTSAPFKDKEEEENRNRPRVTLSQPAARLRYILLLS